MTGPLADDELDFLQAATWTEQDSDSTLLQHQLVTSPLLTYAALKHHPAEFPSRGLLGTTAGDRLYVNTNGPSSAVICGVQGSGKSHTVSCLLECALIRDSRVGQLPDPLSALVFHFDTQDAGRPCEAAFLSSPAAAHQAVLPQVRVLCSPSNVNRRRRAYASLDQVVVQPLYLSEKDLTADRMLAIMGCDNIETMPLYMHTALLIIRNMGVDAFSYREFKRRLDLEQLNFTQRAMIKLRLDLLDAFLRPGAPDIESYFAPGGLVLVDLTDPFLDSLTAAVLFDIVLGTFTQWQTVCGKVVVLDEAHKYLQNNDSARLTQSISNTIRLQRHLATRVIIATQEPTVIPPAMLDLASIIICHRFSSPAWCAHLARHVSAGSDSAAASASWYQQVMLLSTGDALVFSPAALMTADEQGGVGLLGSEHFKLRVRPRLTRDGGASLLAVGRSLPATSSASPSPPQTLPPLTPATSGLGLHVQPESRADIMAAPSRTASTPTASHAMPLAAAASNSMTHSPAAIPGPSNPAARAASSGAFPTPTLATVIPPTASTSAAAAFPAPSFPVAGPFVSGSGPRALPASLQPLVVWLTRNGAADTPANLKKVKTSLLWVWERDYVVGMPKKGGWWNRLMREAVAQGLVEIIHGQLTNRERKAIGVQKMIRLLDRGPFVYV
ncbi:hypothetical protein DFH06DRAFT_511250 [Mycena polygramma]|nr:hypothetical protein DFH06DRAFT_511250 [Mycena polygramma]